MKMGYLGVKYIVAHLRGEAVPKVVDTGVDVATPGEHGHPGDQGAPRARLLPVSRPMTIPGDRVPAERKYPHLAQIHLVNYSVRILDEDRGTGAVTRVLLDSSDGRDSWGSVGVSENVVEASWQALVDSITYGLLRFQEEAPARPAEEPTPPAR